MLTHKYRNIVYLNMRSIKYHILLYLVFFLSTFIGCRDFDQFECFRSEQGCVQLTHLDALVVDLTPVPDQDMISPTDILISQDLEIDMADFAQEDMIPPISSLDLGVDMTPQPLDMSPTLIDMTIPSVDPCGDLSLETSQQISQQMNRPNQEGSLIHWTCVELELPHQTPSRASTTFQIMTAEMSVIQAINIWKDLLEKCQTDSYVLCKSLNEFAINDYIDEFIDEYERRLALTNDENLLDESQVLDRLIHTAISDMDPIEVQDLVNGLNLWATNQNPPHPYEYRLPCYDVWKELYQLGDPNLYTCKTNNQISGVFHGETSLRGGGDIGCRMKRPRGVTSRLHGVQCFDEVWRDLDMNLEVYQEVKENRLLSSNLPLCDLYGNMREILTDCPNHQVCSLGGGWRSQTDNRPMYPQYVNPQADVNDLGFRLIRYLPGDNPCPVNLPHNLIRN